MFANNLITPQGEQKQLESSHVDKLKKIVHRDEETFIGRSNCLTTASSVFFLLTGKSSFFDRKNASLISADTFFLKETYKTQELFSQSGAQEHSVFHLTFGGYLHAFVIEKESNTEGIRYRIYQSWINKFTLQDWLEDEGKHFYTQTELIHFIHKIINQLAREEDKSGWCNFFCCNKRKIIKSISVEIIKFQFNPDALEKNYDRMYHPTITTPGQTLMALT